MKIICRFGWFFIALLVSLILSVDIYYCNGENLKYNLIIITIIILKCLEIIVKKCMSLD